MNYFKEESSQGVATVYKTNDLSQFIQLVGNRPANPQHIARLAQSIIDNGILMNPIIVNKKNEVIDGQHRLLAAKKSNSGIFFIIAENYSLSEVQTLNLNQKNWSKNDFLEGYASMGIESYIKLKDFASKNSDFNIADCLSMCSNTVGLNTATITNKYRKRNGGAYNQKEVFEEGTWVGKDFKVAQDWADKIMMIKPYYAGFNRTSFVRALISMIKKEDFSIFEFIKKIKIQPLKLINLGSIGQYKIIIEEIYNYKRRNKVNLRF